MNRLHPIAGAVEAGVLPGGNRRAPVDIAGEQRLAQGFGGCDRQHTGAGAEIEHPPRPFRPQHLVEQDEATAGGAMMPGAERQRRLDLDADPVGTDTVAVVMAVHHEATGLDRREAFKARLDPVLGFDGVEHQGLRGGLVGRQRDQVAHRGLVRLLAEIQGHIPAPVRSLEGGDGGFVVVEALRQHVHHAVGDALIRHGE